MKASLKLAPIMSSPSLSILNIHLDKTERSHSVAVKILGHKMISAVSVSGGIWLYALTHIRSFSAAASARY